MYYVIFGRIIKSCSLTASFSHLSHFAYPSYNSQKVRVELRTHDQQQQQTLEEEEDSHMSRTWKKSHLLPVPIHDERPLPKVSKIHLEL